MPGRLFRPCSCSRSSTAYLTGRPRCSTCGVSHEFVRWDLVRHEDMARYQYVTGFKPIGPHRPMTDSVLVKSHRKPCDRCHGRGLLTVDRDRWRGCPACEGTGGFWTSSEDELEAARARIRAAYPDAYVKHPTPRFLGGNLARSMGTGEVIDLEAGGPGPSQDAG